MYVNYRTGSESGGENIIWENVDDDMGNFWNRVDMPLSEYAQDDNYRVVFTGEYTQSWALPYGDIAIDDVSFTPNCSFYEGPTSPTSPTKTTPSTTSGPTTPSPCNEHEYHCRGNEGKCIPEAKVCNFIADCPELDDEDTCPHEFTFDDCSSLNDCFWNEDSPDNLDFTIKKIKDLINEGLVEKHGPTSDPSNNTEGSIAYVMNKMRKANMAYMSSPIYRDSYVRCRFEFWYYIAGNIGTDGFMSPVLAHEEGRSFYLDRLVPDSLEKGVWHRSLIGIGKQTGEFKLRIELTPNEGDYDAGVAIDDVGFLECAPDYPEEKCHEGFFHCTQSKICIPKAELCDLTDQCTDNSDEETEECADAKKDTFENDEKPFGLFDHNEEYSDFEWERGSGTGDGWFGGSPPFDHTTFSNRGHYLYIKVIFPLDQS